MNRIYQQQQPQQHQQQQSQAADLLQVINPDTNFLNPADHSQQSAGDVVPNSQSSLAEEFCPIHPNEMLVAYDNNLKRLVCNQCIYESDVLSLENAMSQLSFTSFIAGNLKDLFDTKFTDYRKSLESMQQVAPQQITKQLEGTVDSFFGAIMQQIKQVEAQTLMKIRNSKNLSDLERLLTQQEPTFGHQDERKYEQARQEIEMSVKRGSYSEVVSKKDLYEGLISQMQTQSNSMGSAIKDSQDCIGKIMNIKSNQEASSLIGKRLHEIIDACLEIDGVSAQAAADEQKRQKVAEEMQRQKEAEQRAKQEQAEKIKRIQDAKLEQERQIRERQEQQRLEQERVDKERAEQARQIELQRLRQAAIERQKQADEAERLRLAKEAEDKRQADLVKSREEARQAIMARQRQEQQRQEEMARVQAAEQERQAEIARRQAEHARQQEEQRLREQELAAQKQREEQQAELRRQEIARQQQLQREAVEKARLAEQQKQIELERQQEAQRQQEVQRQNELQRMLLLRQQQQQQEQEAQRQRQEQERQAAAAAAALEQKKQQEQAERDRASHIAALAAQKAMQESVMLEQQHREEQQAALRKSENDMIQRLQEKQQQEFNQLNQANMPLEQVQPQATAQEDVAMMVDDRVDDDENGEDQDTIICELTEPHATAMAIQQQSSLNCDDSGKDASAVGGAAQNPNDTRMISTTVGPSAMEQQIGCFSPPIKLPNSDVQSQEEPQPTYQPMASQVSGVDRTSSNHEGAVQQIDRLSAQQQQLRESQQIQDHVSQGGQRESLPQEVLTQEQRVSENQKRISEMQDRISNQQRMSQPATETQPQAPNVMQVAPQVAEPEVMVIQNPVNTNTEQVLNLAPDRTSSNDRGTGGFTSHYVPPQQNLNRTSSPQANYQPEPPSQTLTQTLSQTESQCMTQEQSVPLVATATNQSYKSLINSKQQKIYRNCPLTNDKLDQKEIYSIQGMPILSKAVTLPTGRVFLIGGTNDIHCSQTVKTTLEIFPETSQAPIERANMFTARASFGCAIYPNFSQIFIAGGSISDQEATKSCERYIIENNQWKRLPEMREAKTNASLCFFNNGSTLYCFGGVKKAGSHAMETLNSIERLSKGVSNWQKLDVVLPRCIFDVGAHHIPNTNDIVVFGGYSEQAPLDEVFIYKTALNDGQGSFKINESKLAHADFMQINGAVIKGTNPDCLVFQCHSYMHKFDIATSNFSVFKLNDEAGEKKDAK